MNTTHYIFAAYVFLLVCAGIWFYSRVMARAKLRNKSNYEKEQKLFSLYQEIEDMLKGFEQYAEEAKAEIDAQLKQAEQLAWGKQAAELPEPELGRVPLDVLLPEELPELPVIETQPEPAFVPEPEPPKAKRNTRAKILAEEKPAKKAEKKTENPTKISKTTKKAAPKAAEPEEKSAPMETTSVQPMPVETPTAQPDQPEATLVQPAAENATEQAVLAYAARGIDQKVIAKELGISSRQVALILEIKKMAVSARES